MRPRKLGAILLGMAVLAPVLSLVLTTCAEAQFHTIHAADGSVYVTSTMGNSTVVMPLYESGKYPLPKYQPPTRTYYSAPAPQRTAHRASVWRWVKDKRGKMRLRKVTP